MRCLEMNNRHNPKLTDIAKRLRRNMTKEERHLWYDFLKSMPMTFQRQKVIGGYIVDFFCASTKLVIELDGSQHFEDTRAAADKIRDDYLQGLGLKIKRYSNADVNQRFGSVCSDIYNMIFPEGE
jgi:very-short-patch-repair endonuclease